MTPDTLRYAGFWPRSGSIILDILILLPLSLVAFSGENHYRLFDLYYLVPDALIWLFFGVWLVRRFGGTPGKLIMGIRIRKVNGEPAGYREAMLRYLPDFILTLLSAIAMTIPLLNMTDAEYATLSFMERAHRVVALAPSWYHPLEILQQIWGGSELLVLLTNRKRRALHDFIAGTVVVYASSLPKAQSPDTDRTVLTAQPS